MVKKLILISMLFSSLFFNLFAEDNQDKLERFNNFSIYQHSENNNYKISLFTSLKKGTWFVQNIFDKFYSATWNVSTNYYTITTAGKYITKNTSVRIQIEKGGNFRTNYYFGIGVDF